MSRSRHALRRAAPALAVLALTAATLASCGDDDDDDTSPTSSATPSSVIADTLAPTAPATTVNPTSPPTTAPSGTTEPGPTSTAVPPLVKLSGETVQAASTSLANPFMLERVGVFSGLVVFDGESVDGDFALRCIAVGHEGDVRRSARLPRARRTDK